MRVSWATGLPSAVIEIQVVWSARITRVKVPGSFAVSTRVALSATGESAEGEFTAAGGTLAGVDALGDADRIAAEDLATDGFVPEEIGAVFVEGAEADDSVAAGDCVGGSEEDGFEAADVDVDSWCR